MSTHYLADLKQAKTTWKGRCTGCVWEYTSDQNGTPEEVEAAHAEHARFRAEAQTPVPLTESEADVVLLSLTRWALPRTDAERQVIETIVGRLQATFPRHERPQN